MSALPASAYMRHHHYYHHYYHRPTSGVTRADDQVDTGFGPTAAGVSAILIDARSGAVLSANGADIPRYPASLTKLMTLDLAFRALRAGQISLDTRIPVSYHASAVEPVKLGLTPGDTISVRSAILAMTTMSANDAATALGEYLGGGSEARCAELMTARAQALGMAQTHFANASGLPNATQVTTARDLALLARDIVLNYPEDQQFFEVVSFNFRGHTVYSNNNMLRSYPGATGMKTGYTDLARHNLVTSAVRDGRVLIGVELHEPSWGDTYAQMTHLLNAGFEGRLAANGSVLTPAIGQTAAAPQLAQAAPLPEPPPAAPGLPAGTQMAGAQMAEAAPALALPPPPPPAHYVARRAEIRPAADHAGHWVAQIGLYSRLAKARTEAFAMHRLSGAGVVRIARVEHHGRTLWGAQLADLSFDAAHSTCSVVNARGGACHVVSVGEDHVAMLSDSPDGT
jgi:D-alanyl-D-alanine carboxypeptidase